MCLCISYKDNSHADYFRLTLRVQENIDLFSKDPHKTIRSHIYNIITYLRFIYNSSVRALKIDQVSVNVYGTVDNNTDDQTRYDYVILAADVGSVKAILNETIENNIQTPFIFKILKEINDTSIGRMKVAPEYKVVRVWFDKQLNSSTPDILETPDFSPVNLIAQYHLLEDEFINWAQETGGSVIEFHCYSWSTSMDPNIPDEHVWGNISSTVKQIYPEIFERNFQVLATHVNSFHDFASFELGLLNFRFVFLNFNLNLAELFMLLF